MSRRSPFGGSKFRHVFGKPSSRERGYGGVPIARSVHDTHGCSANPRFLAVVTECAGGGSFLVLPIRHTGRVDPQHPRVCGHSGRVLDVKWNPFDDHCVASCSEDCTVKIWDIPVCGVQQNLTKARTTLIGHSRRVALIEWHPTAENLLLSSAYDYKVLLWDVSQGGAVLRYPVRVVLMPVHHRCPSDALLLSVSFNSDGSRLAVTSKDRRVRVLDPRTGRILQASSSKSHRASKVLFIGGLKMLLSTGSSPWNHRQIVLWDPDDLSEPLFEEELDGCAGVLFPFYDPDTHMLYLAGKGDGNIRYYELSREKPYISFLSEVRSLLPQKGLGVMPKRGLDVSSCEVFRFYRLIAIKDLVEPLSMIVPRKESDAFQEDLFPMTAGNQAAMTAQEWLLGINRSPVLMSLRPGTRVINPYPETPAEKGLVRQLSGLRFQMDPAAVAVTGPALDFMEEDTSTGTGGDEDRTADPPKDDQLDKTPRDFNFQPGGAHTNILQQTTTAFLEEQLAYQDAKYPRDMSDLCGWQPDETHCCTPHCCEPAERPPPTRESELLQAYYRQQDKIRGLREQLNAKDVRITQLELDIQNTRNNMRATF
ncbi:coronin-2B-like isoform X2 [Pseudoliparis swirei]|uniref:coronin-2B-like isoform X2 n=1 Tax=Pseudoliparis swirei TaxID=2059687 RepID=UPI0024BE0DE5|nr:coronin-2B-like isoform X2 [Pseudoliparis swirei]